MKATYIYKSAFGDSLLTVTGKSAARGRDSVHNLRWERTRYIDRIDELNRNVKNLRRANAVCRNHARKEGERMLADIERLHNELEEARRDSDNALRIAEKDKRVLLDKIEALQAENERLKKENEQVQSDVWFSMLWEENENLGDEITRLQEAYESLNEENKSLCSEIARLNAELADEQTFALHGWTLAHENAKLNDKLSDRLHACRIDRRKWRDIAERCFAAAMKNAVALADDRKGKRGE